MYKIDKELDEKSLLDFVNKHRMSLNRYKTLNDYYLGKHKILTEDKLNDYDTHRNVVNFCKVAVMTTTGYLTGKPIVYTCSNQEYSQKLNEIFDRNDEDEKNTEIDKRTAIKGVQYELHYIGTDEEGLPLPRFALVEPEEMFLIYDYSIEPVLKYAVRVYQTEDSEFIEVYDNKNIKKYTKSGKDGIVLQSIEEHHYKEVPVVEFVQNSEKMAVFEDFMSLQDDYNKQVTNQSNNLNYFTDAYMVLENMEGTEAEDVEQARRDKIFKTPADAKISWLLKPMDDTVIENHKKTLKDSIFLIGCFPDWSSNEFAGNLSGVAIAFKILNLEQLCSVKETKMKKSLNKRIRLITNILNLRGGGLNYKPNDVQISFTRNLPQNIEEIAETVYKLNGIVSRERLLSLLPFIEDISEEMQRKKEEDLDLSDEDIKGILAKYVTEAA